MLSQQSLEVVLPGGSETEPEASATVVIVETPGPSDALRADIAFLTHDAGKEPADTERVIV